MKREEAIKILKAIRVYECYPKSASEETKDAIDMAIEALSAEAEEYEDYEHATLVDIKAPLRASAEAVQRWIPFKKRPLTDEEKQEYPDWTYIFDCPLPNDEQEILLSNGKYVWTDTFINDGECYLDGGDDIDDGMAWRSLPEPYKGGEDE